MTTRRSFIKSAGLAAAAVTIVPRHVLGNGYIAPSDKLNIAGIGVGGKGQSDIASFASIDGKVKGTNAKLRTCAMWTIAGQLPR
jgi:hypothetical protein